MVFKFEIDTKDLNDPDPSTLKQTVEDFRCLIQFLCNANPDYYIIGGILMDQLKAQTKSITDPKQDMIVQWEKILDRATVCKSREEYVSLHDGIRDAVDNFFNQIGEAMGPVCYAGYQLMQRLKKYNLSTEWVENCITYYQDNWDM